MSGIKWYDGPLRFLVPSDSPDVDPYLVELNTYDGNGKCTCTHFATRIEPYLVRGMQPLVDPRCKHIKRAREFYIDETIKAIAEKNPT
jgi:hypothetical protein